MNLRLLLLTLIIFPVALMAQKREKPKMLVYGSDITALTAAVQAARSSVPTIWVLDQEQIAPEITSQTLKMVKNENLDAGIWMNLLMEMGMSKTKSDSLAMAVKADFNPRLARNAIEKMLRELPNLTIVRDQQILNVEKKRREWQIQLANRQSIQVLSVVDASKDGLLFKKAEGTKKEGLSSSLQKAKEVSLAASRTTLAVGELKEEVYVLLLKDLLTFEKENLFDIGFLRELDADPENIAFRAAYGQALGATAGYVAFFKTDTKSIDIRKLQAELLGFSARLNPYQDVKTTDVHYGSIQKSYLSGFFLGKVEGDKYMFKGDDFVKFGDVKDVLNDIYTRSQLWFLDNYKEEDMTWRDLFSLIKFVSFKGDEVERQVEKDWKSRRKFEGEFDLDSKITRDHFAVMADLYSTAFAKAINLDGSFVK
ncbi:FAD-dependent oxidoreductase [Sphingobacterium sp. PU5-4]|uniref:FAD-dependent oxidoreductase n=1 Tax=Sphingobacterium tenebrionis TaxID=3111775 RepID=A0ABU8I301_9SPHI